MDLTTAKAPGEKLRGRLNWLILKTLAMDVGVPISLAEFVELMRFLSSRTPAQALYRSRHPSYLTTYLYRLADRGYVKLEGLRRQRRATLTPTGRKALGALETLFREEGMRKLPATANDLARRLAEIRRCHSVLTGSAALLRRMDRQRRALLRAIPGRPRASGFVSYDLPQRESNRRRLILAILKGYGFTRLHQSMYVGHARHLRRALETLESVGVLPFLRWGTLTVFGP